MSHTYLYITVIGQHRQICPKAHVSNAMFTKPEWTCFTACQLR